MELRSTVRPPKRFGIDDEPAVNVLRSTGPKPHSKPFNPNLPLAPFPSWDANEDHGISSAIHLDEGQHAQTKRSVDNFAQTTLSFSAGVTGSSAQRVIRQLPGTDGIYISTPRDILTFYRLMDEWVRTKDSQESQPESCSDNGVQADLHYNETNQTETRPINENGALISELANEFKLLHPTLRSTIIRAVIEREGISEDDIERELATPLPYWLGIDENSVKCVLHDYMVMSREPTFEGPSDGDVNKAWMFLHRASMPDSLLYPWTNLETNLHNADNCGNGYAIDEGTASSIYNSFDYGDPLNNYYTYHDPNITTSKGVYQYSSSLQPVIDLQDHACMSDQGYYNKHLSQPEDLSAQSGLYSEDFINNIKTEENTFPYWPIEHNAPAALAVNQPYSSTVLTASDFAMPASPPADLCFKSLHFSPILPSSNSWADNNMPMQNMSIPNCMSTSLYGNQYNHAFHYNHNPNYSFGSTTARPLSASASGTFVTSAIADTATTINNKKTQAENKGKGKAKVNDITNTLDNSSIKSTGGVCYAGLPHSFTYNSLSSTMPSPAQPMTGIAQSGPSGRPEPPKRKRGRPKKEVSVVVDENGTASVRTSGGGNSRAGRGRDGTKTKRAKKAANNQQMTASEASSKRNEGFTDMNFVKKN